MRRFFPILAILWFTALFFRKTIVQGLIPIPFDLLVAWFFPYTEGGWDGVWTIYKGGHFAADAIRQIYPWRELATSLVKEGTLPLWNPYAFSGTPLLANFQTAVFYPLNIIFLLIPNFPLSWAIYLASSLFLGAIWMYLFQRSLKRSPASALLAAIAFTASGYMIVWLEWGVVVHAMIWLPLSLLAVTGWLRHRRKRYLFLLAISLTSTIFAGYAQGAAYNLLVVMLWTVYKVRTAPQGKRQRVAVPLLVTGALAVGLTSIQWLPTMELYFHSAMRGEASQTLAEGGVFPFVQLATLLAPDYFGNRVSNDYWGKEIGNLDYMDADIYVGAVTLLLALGTLFAKGKADKKFWLVLLVTGLLLGLDSPIPRLVARAGIPVVSTGVAAETLVISMFALSCLAAIGLDGWEKQTRKLKLITLTTIAALYALLFLIAGSLEMQKATVAKQSLLVPAIAFLSAAAILLIPLSSTTAQGAKAYLLTGVLMGELLFHAEKILPFSLSQFAFPRNELTETVRDLARYDRVDGFWESEIATNFHTAFRLYSAEGYDPLYIRRYGEFVTAAQEGKLVERVPRSDADITQKNEGNRNRLLDLTSIRYVVSKVTDTTQTWEEEPLKYDPSRFHLLWQSGKFKIYENLHALPRVKLFYDWKVIPEDNQIISTLYNPQFDPREQLILEKEPEIKLTSDGVRPRKNTNLADSSEVEIQKSRARIASYTPTRVEIEAETDKPAILLLTDSYYPGWKATIDGHPATIMRASYTFRALAIPPGIHSVVFRYSPSSVQWGIAITFICLLFGILLLRVTLADTKKRQ